jgi:hypothetical protein
MVMGRKTQARRMEKTSNQKNQEKAKKNGRVKGIWFFVPPEAQHLNGMAENFMKSV